MIINPYKAKLIHFEGYDGTGKSEQFERIRQMLRERADVFFTKEPTDMPTGVEIYQILKGEHPRTKLEDIGDDGIQRLYFEDRLLQTKKRLMPNLAKGVHVFSDRGPLSSLAFGSQNESDFERIMRIGSRVFRESENPFIELLWPNLILIYDVPIEVAMSRLQSSGKKLDKFERIEKGKVVLDNYRKLSRIYPNCVIIDATGTPDQVFEQTKEHILKALL